MRLPLPPPRLNRPQRAALWVADHAEWTVVVGIVVGLGDLGASGGLATAGYAVAAAAASVLAFGWIGAGMSVGPLVRSATRPCPGWVAEHGIDTGESYEDRNRLADPESGWTAYLTLRGPLEEAGRPVYEAMLDACAVYLEDPTEENGTPIARRLQALHRLAAEQRRIDARVTRASLARDDGDLERVDVFLAELDRLNHPELAAQAEVLEQGAQAEVRVRRFRRVG